MATESLHADRSAALTITTSGEFEVELFAPYTMADGEVRQAHAFRDFTPDVGMARAWIVAWLDGR